MMAMGGHCSAAHRFVRPQLGSLALLSLIQRLYQLKSHDNVVGDSGFRV